MILQQLPTDLAQLLSLNQRSLYAFIRGQVRTREDADDVYQETTVVLVEQYNPAEPPGNFFAWACGIAWRKVLVEYRNRSRLKLLANEELGRILAEKVAASVAWVSPRIDRLQECIASLKTESRDIIEGFYFREESVTQIAARLGVSEPCVYKTLTKIRRTLLDCIERKLREDD